MRAVVKRLVVGTRWEVPVKRLHHTLTRSQNSLYDCQTIAIMRRVLRPNSNGIDVGAFEGGMLRHMLRFAPGGRHLAFEPTPDRFERLRRAFPSVQVYPYALAETSGAASYHRVLAHPALSGLLRRRDLPAEERGVDITVTRETLDRLVPPEQAVALVKIDVEGGELGVFRGGVETLRRTRPVVVFECGLGGADTYGATPGEIYDVVAERIGLRISLLPGWLDGRSPLSRAGFVEQFERSLNYCFAAHP